MSTDESSPEVQAGSSSGSDAQSPGEGGLARLPETQDAFDALLDRVHALAPLQDRVRQAHEALEQRASEAFRVAKVLRDIPRGEVQVVRHAIRDVKAEYAEQTARLDALTHRLSRERLKILALVRALRLSIRDTLGEIVHEAGLAESAAATADQGAKEFGTVESWMAAELDRWQPSTTGVPPGMDLDMFHEMLPDLDGTAGNGALPAAGRGFAVDDTDEEDGRDLGV